MSVKQKYKLIKIIISGILFAVFAMVSVDNNIKIWMYLVPYIITGGSVIKKAIRNILRGQIFDENFLMTLATVGAFLIGEYPEGVAVMLFYQIGEFFENYAVGKSRGSIAELMDIQPEYANLEKDNSVVKVSPYDVSEGDAIVIKPGEKIPLDGEIINGASALDTSAITGEALPRGVKAGDVVSSGCINLNGVIKVKVLRKYENSTVAKILDLVENAASHKAETENFITKFARYYTPVVVICAALLGLIPSVITGEYVLWINRALIFLVISCPCALVISVPLSFFGGIGGASKKGILIKGSSYIEALADAKTVVFDKTGTLTEGSLVIREIKAVDCTEDELLNLAAEAESFSNHPIAMSLCKAVGKKISNTTMINGEEIPGMGVKAILDGKEIYAGNEKLMKSLGIVPWLPNLAGTVVHISKDGQYMGYILAADKIKEGAAAEIVRLKSVGIKNTLMLTGDINEVGEAVGKEVGVDIVYTQLLPEDKVTKVEEHIDMQGDGSLIFVGDGINDAPVLMRADVGIAMGDIGSAAAIEAADVVLINDRLSSVADVIKISKRTMRIVKQNIVFALAVKGIILVLGALGIANMWLAVFADVGVSVIAIANAMRTMWDCHR